MILWIKYRLHLVKIQRKLDRIVFKTIRESNWDVFSEFKRVEVFTDIFNKVIRKDIINNLDFSGSNNYKGEIDAILDKSFKNGMEKLRMLN